MRPKAGSLLKPKRSVSEAVERAAEASEKSDRIVSLKRFGELTGRDRETIAKWTDPSRKDACPVVSRGGPGEATFVDIKAVLAWREEQVRKEERKRFATPDGGEPVPAAERLKERQIRQADQKMAILAKILIHREPLQMAIRQANGLARQTVMSIPEQLVRKIGSALPRDKTQELYQEAWTLCAASLTSWATEVNAAMQAAAERVVDLGDDDEDG